MDREGEGDGRDGDGDQGRRRRGDGEGRRRRGAKLRDAREGLSTFGRRRVNVVYQWVEHISGSNTLYYFINAILNYKTTTLGTNYNYIRSR